LGRWNAKAFRGKILTRGMRIAEEREFFYTKFTNFHELKKAEKFLTGGNGGNGGKMESGRRPVLRNGKSN
jgi:hypothetical protein